MTILYVGRKVPKKFNELAGAIHLGKGKYLFRVELKESEKKLDKFICPECLSVFFSMMEIVNHGIICQKKSRGNKT